MVDRLDRINREVAQLVGLDNTDDAAMYLYRPTSNPATCFGLLEYTLKQFGGIEYVVVDRIAFEGKNWVVQLGCGPTKMWIGEGDTMTEAIAYACLNALRSLSRH